MIEWINTPLDRFILKTRIVATETENDLIDAIVLMKRMIEKMNDLLIKANGYGLPEIKDYYEAAIERISERHFFAKIDEELSKDVKFQIEELNKKFHVKIEENSKFEFNGNRQLVDFGYKKIPEEWIKEIELKDRTEWIDA